MAVTGDSSGLNRAFLARLDAASREVGDLHVVSGYRSRDKQAWLYGCFLERRRTGRCPPRCGGNCNPANPPGMSQHEFRLAADLSTDSWRRLTARKARRFGLTYTIRGEPWHIEPIGSFHHDAELDNLGWIAAANAE